MVGKPQDNPHRPDVRIMVDMSNEELSIAVNVLV